MMAFGRRLGRDRLSWLAACHCVSVAAFLVMLTWRSTLAHRLHIPTFDTILLALHFEEHGTSWFYPAVDHLLAVPMWFLGFDHFFLSATGWSVTLGSLGASLMTGAGFAAGPGIRPCDGRESIRGDRIRR